MFLISLAWVIAALTIGYTRNVNSLASDAKKALIDYFKSISDVESRYIVDKHLARTVARLYNNSVGAFPVFDVSVKIDRNPVEIPWDTDQVDNNLDLNTVPLPYAVRDKALPKHINQETVAETYADPIVTENKKLKFRVNSQAKAELVNNYPGKREENAEAASYAEYANPDSQLFSGAGQYSGGSSYGSSNYAQVPYYDPPLVKRNTQRYINDGGIQYAAIERENRRDRRRRN